MLALLKSLCIECALAVEQVAKACVPFGAKDVEVHALSLNDNAAVDKLAQSLVEKHKVIDVLVCLLFLTA